MSARLVSMAYAYPDSLRRVALPDGREVLERVPGSATRIARPTDFNTWREEIPDGVAPDPAPTKSES